MVAVEATGLLQVASSDAKQFDSLFQEFRGPGPGPRTPTATQTTQEIEQRSISVVNNITIKVHIKGNTGKYRVMTVSKKT